MKFDDDAKIDTSQIDDQRGRSSGGGFGGLGRSSRAGMGGGGMGGGRMPIPMGKKGGIGGILIMLLMAFVLPKLLGGGGGGGGGLGQSPFGADAGQNLQPVDVQDAAPQQVESECKTGADANKRQDCRIAIVVNSVNQFWGEVYAANNLKYTVAQTTYFTGDVQTGCGPATSAVGPFYCPADMKAYLDLGFFKELETKFGAIGGDFAEAYVVAHEYGHHIQNLTGISKKVQDSGDREGPESAAVRLELQADCYAGVWANNATSGPDPLIVEISDADIKEGIDAAQRVGDDFIQETFQGSVNPETWTHGSSAQREKWFKTGLRTGEPSSCDTFSGDI